jgi:iron complex transport system ATP-binding protein
MAQRAAIARGLFSQPELLLLDEPFSAVDAFTRMRLQDLLLRVAAHHGTTVLLVTHDIEAIVPEIQRCLLLHQGRVLADGPPQEVLRDGPLSALYGTPLRVVSASGFRQVLPAV